MKHLVYKIIVTAFEAVKIIASVLILLFPMQLIEWLYPFVFISPLLLCAVAYAGIPKCLLIILLLLVVVLILSLPICTLILYIRKKNIRFYATVLQIVFCAEALCLCLSLFFGSLVLGKLIGITFNLAATIMLNKIKDELEVI